MGCCNLTLYCVLLLVPRLVLVAVLWLALPAVGYALLLPAVGLALLGSFHRFSPSRRLSAALRAHRFFDLLVAVLVPVLLYFILFPTDSLAVVLSRILTTGSLAVVPYLSHIVVVYDSVVRFWLHPTPLLSIAPLRDLWFAVGARAPRSCSSQQRVLLTVGTGLRGSLPLRSVGGFHHRSNTTVCFSGLCPPLNEGLHRGLLPRRGPSCPRSSYLSLLVLVSFTGLVIVARYFPSRHADCSSHALKLCRSVFLLNVAVFVDLALYLAVCGLASVELSCSLTTLVLHARMAPFPRLPVLGAVHALFLSCSLARDLQFLTWRLRFCLSARIRASENSGPCCESSSGSSVLLMARVKSLQFVAQL